MAKIIQMTDSDGNVYPKAPSLVDISDKFTYQLTYGDGWIKAYYDRTTGIVRGSFAVYNSTTSVFNQSTPFYLIASGYRPSANVTVPMMVEARANNVNTWYSSYGVIYPSGAIAQNMTASGHQCYGTFEYYV